MLFKTVCFQNGTGRFARAASAAFFVDDQAACHAQGNLLRGHDRASALLMAAEGNGFGDVRQYYDHLPEHLRRHDLGHVLAGGNGDVGDIEGKPQLQQAYGLGRSIR